CRGPALYCDHLAQPSLGDEEGEMLKEENELLTRVGPGTPMGELLRQYWIPVLQSEELADPDGAPQRVRLLTEELIIFRDTDGQVGLFAANCPHRGASL